MQQEKNFLGLYNYVQSLFCSIVEQNLRKPKKFKVPWVGRSLDRGPVTY